MQDLDTFDSVSNKDLQRIEGGLTARLGSFYFEGASLSIPGVFSASLGSAYFGGAHLTI